jgi:hypothetical protein
MAQKGLFASDDDDDETDKCVTCFRDIAHRHVRKETEEKWNVSVGRVTPETSRNRSSDHWMAASVGCEEYCL